jgi:hypothetical protein
MWTICVANRSKCLEKWTSAKSISRISHTVARIRTERTICLAQLQERNHKMLGLQIKMWDLVCHLVLALNHPTPHGLPVGETRNDPRVKTGERSLRNARPSRTKKLSELFVEQSTSALSQ